jgi:hypothetical protein
MKKGWKIILIGFGLLAAARIVAIPFARRFAEVNHGDGIVPDAIAVGQEVWPWTVGSFLLLCAAGIFLLIGVIQLIIGAQSNKK